MTTLTTRQRAIAWMSNHRHIIDIFEKYARPLVYRDRFFGINLIREVVRWEAVYEYETPYKFPNDFSPYVARYLLWKHPSWRENIECRFTSDETTKIEYITDEQLDNPPSDKLPPSNNV
jgi:hypothetical protein